MNCPLCTEVALVAHVRRGIEVDICPHCKGIWLDRGELDRLLDIAEESAPATGGHAVPAAPRPLPPPAPAADGLRGHRDGDPTGDPSQTPRGQYSRKYAKGYGKSDKKRKKKRKKSLGDRLEDFFDDVLDL